jgi:uncharacterized protein YeaO (DUF488 family)
MIQIKRVYEPHSPSDGARFLVDRLWPRGLTKKQVHVERWIKDVSPTNELRQWYGHEPAKWKEFQRRYFAELDQNPTGWLPLLEAAREGVITLTFSSRELERNNAAALKIYLEMQLKAKHSRRSAGPPGQQAKRPDSTESALGRSGRESSTRWDQKSTRAESRRRQS